MIMVVCINTLAFVWNFHNVALVFAFVFVFVFDKGALLGERRGACLMPFVDAF